VSRQRRNATPGPSKPRQAKSIPDPATSRPPSSRSSFTKERSAAQFSTATNPASRESSDDDNLLISFSEDYRRRHHISKPVPPIDAEKPKKAQRCKGWFPKSIIKRILIADVETSSAHAASPVIEISSDSELERRVARKAPPSNRHSMPATGIIVISSDTDDDPRMKTAKSRRSPTVEIINADPPSRRVSTNTNTSPALLRSQATSQKQLVSSNADPRRESLSTDSVGAVFANASDAPMALDEVVGRSIASREGTGGTSPDQIDKSSSVSLSLPGSSPMLPASPRSPAHCSQKSSKPIGDDSTPMSSRQSSSDYSLPGDKPGTHLSGTTSTSSAQPSSASQHMLEDDTQADVMQLNSAQKQGSHTVCRTPSESSTTGHAKWQLGSQDEGFDADADGLWAPFYRERPSLRAQAWVRQQHQPAIEKEVSPTSPSEHQVTTIAITCTGSTSKTSLPHNTNNRDEATPSDARMVIGYTSSPISVQNSSAPGPDQSFGDTAADSDVSGRADNTVLAAASRATTGLGSDSDERSPEASRRPSTSASASLSAISDLSAIDLQYLRALYRKSGLVASNESSRANTESSSAPTHPVRRKPSQSPATSSVYDRDHSISISPKVSFRSLSPLPSPAISNDDRVEIPPPRPQAVTAVKTDEPTVLEQSDVSMDLSSAHVAAGSNSSYYRSQTEVAEEQECHDMLASAATSDAEVSYFSSVTSAPSPRFQFNRWPMTMRRIQIQVLHLSRLTRR
jgi:hypothetical protein